MCIAKMNSVWKWSLSYQPNTSLWVVKRANPRKKLYKKISLKGGQRDIFLRLHAFLHLKSYLIEYVTKVQHGVVWAWFPLVNKSLYSVNGPSFHYKFRPKLSSQFGELCSQGYDQQSEKGGTCMQSSRIWDFGLRISLPFKKNMYNPSTTD